MDDIRANILNDCFKHELIRIKTFYNCNHSLARITPYCLDHYCATATYFGNAMTDAKQYDIGLKNKLQKPFTVCAIMQRKLCAPQTRWHQLGINQLILSAELTVGSQLHLGECCYTHSKFGRISEFMQTTTVNCQLIVDKLRLMCGFIRFILSS